jgi:hypothetical protein
MGTAGAPLSPQSQLLSQTRAFTTNASGAATITFPNPPQGFTWTGTLNCATATTGAVFLASVGAVSWGEWGGNSVYGPVQVLGAGSQQLVVTVTGLAANTNYTLQWNGSSDPSEMVAAVWPDANSTALTAQISGTVPVSVAGTVNTTGTTSITGGSVGINGSVATTQGSTLTTATGTGASTTLTVASTSTFTSQGLLSVVASGGTLIFSYTGTTSTTFTGLTLLTGSSVWTIAIGATVVQSASSSLSGTVTTNPLAPAADLLYQGTYTTTWTTPPTITLVNESENSTYVGFMVVFTSMAYTTHIGQGGTLTFTNNVTGQKSIQYVSIIRTAYNLGLQTYFSVPVDGGNSYTITFVPAVSSSGGGSVNISWNIIGYRQPPVLPVIGSSIASLDTVPYGGSLSTTASLATLTNQTLSQTITDGITQVTRVQMVAAVMTSAAATITGYVSFCDGSTSIPFAAMDMTQGTSATHAASMACNGVLLTQGGGCVVNNQTNKTLLVSVFYDVLANPNIS